MSGVDIQTLPELGNDEVLESLISTFNARLVQADTAEHYIGNVTTRIRLGEHEYLTLPTVRLTLACHKAELERARATMFATYLVQLGRDSARNLWKQAAQWEGSEFMSWVKLDVLTKQQKGELA